MGDITSKRQSIAARLKIAREWAGLSQAQVAKELGLHRPSVSELEAGRRRVSAEELTAFADLYQVSPEWLLSSDEEINIPGNGGEIELAARELSKLKPDDLKRIVSLLKALQRTNKEIDETTKR